MKEEEILLSEIFFRASNRFSLIESFRQVASLGLPYVTKEVQRDTYEFVRAMAYGKEFDHLFTDKGKFFEMVGGVEAHAQITTEYKIKTYEVAVDAASLVFAHSILDNAALEYCRITALISPEDWKFAVGGKKVPLEELEGSTYIEILKEKIEVFFRELERNSLLEKVHRLFQVCKPLEGSTLVEHYKYDRDRLKELDKMRHDIVHGDGPGNKLPNGEGDIDYLIKTNTFLAVLVCDRYGLKLHPEGFKRALFQSKKPTLPA